MKYDERFNYIVRERILTVVKCSMKKCKFNKNNICSKDEIEIDKITTYDEDNTECMDYDKKILN